VADVLAEWVGLGYNRRALRLREACAVVAREGWPEDLRALPGIGPYTAAAVGAFAFGRDELPVDTNVRRVLERTGFAPAHTPPELGQALMELGAVVCRARDAACGACPVAGAGCASAGAVAIAPRARAGEGTVRERFEDSNRWVRGRVIEALAVGSELPDGIELERLERAIDSLVRDGLVVRGEDGLSLPVV
jgi:A/G-specific adenine glycosylase